MFEHSPLAPSAERRDRLGDLASADARRCRHPSCRRGTRQLRHRLSPRRRRRRRRGEDRHADLVDERRDVRGGHRLDWPCHFQFVGLDDIGARIERGEPFTTPVAAVTFDDGYRDV